MIVKSPEHREKLKAKFMERVNITPDCWLWLGYLNPGGYGNFYWGAAVKAHRAAYTLFVGPIPDGLHLDHLCRIRNCVNPKHLEPVTHRENILRGIAPTSNKRRYLEQTHCKRGHERIPENLNYRQGRRVCRVCENIRARERWANRTQEINARRRATYQWQQASLREGGE